jgi:peptide-methionine (S)-S-oxide reductase
MELATFGAGCFWGVESAFRQIPGVTDVKVGYEGGTVVNPSYKDVCTDRTGHAEVVQAAFDPAKVSYDKLLDAFWNMHDPTTLNRQGPDFGTQYRSVIFTHSPEQEVAAKAALAKQAASGRFKRPIVTQVVPASTFYPAEEYHQRYFEKQGIAPTCHI